MYFRVPTLIQAHNPSNGPEGSKAVLVKGWVSGFLKDKSQPEISPLVFRMILRRLKKIVRDFSISSKL